MNNLQFRTGVMQIAKQYMLDNPAFAKKNKIAVAEELILRPIVSKIKIELKGPDDLLMEKFSVNERLFFVAKGVCAVDFRRGNLNAQETSQNLRMAERKCGIID